MLLMNASRHIEPINASNYNGRLCNIESKVKELSSLTNLFDQSLKKLNIDVAKVDQIKRQQLSDAF